MDEIVVKVLVEIVTMLTLATEELKQRQSSEFVLIYVLCCSAPCSQICKDFFQGEGRQGGAKAARPTDAR